jgi:hypothetical protein
MRRSNALESYTIGLGELSHLRPLSLLKGCLLLTVSILGQTLPRSPLQVSSENTVSLRLPSSRKAMLQACDST